MNIYESQLQSRVLGLIVAEPLCALLRPTGELQGDPHALAVFWRVNTGAVGHMRFGVNGQADITGCVRGRRVEFELKSPKGRQSTEQRAFQRHVERAGALYVLVRTEAEFFTPVRHLLGS